MNLGRRAAAALLVAVLLLAGPLGRFGAGIGPAPAVAGVGDFVAGQPGCGRVALIFNVGSGFDPALGMMDTLASYGVPATIFMMGWWVDWYPDAANYIASFGYPIGSHGNLPPEYTVRSDDDIMNDVWATEAAFHRQLGFAPGPWFTAFAGASDARVNALVANLGYTMIGWEVETGDWDPNVSASMIYDRVMTQVYDGAIIELHLDSAGSTYTTATALPWIIEDLSAQGYTFVTIPQMMQPCY